MRIWLVVAYEPLPRVDGDVRLLRYGTLGTMLAAQGHTVTWWTSNFDHVRKRHRFDSPPSSIEIQPGLTAKLLPASGYKRNVSVNRIRHNRSIAHAFEQQSQNCDDQPDIIFASLPTLELAEKAVQYAQNIHIPVIVDVVDKWPDLYLTIFPEILHGLVRIALTSEFNRTRRILQSATAITAISSTYLQWALVKAKRSWREIDAVFPLGYAVSQEGIEAESESQSAQLLSNYGICPDSLLVTFLGQFGASYDLETVVRAAQIMRDDVNIKFVLAGEGDKGASLKKMAHGLPNVIFTGWLDRLAMRTLLVLSSVGLAAYTDRALQSLPYKTFEYMSAGLPILSSLKGEMEKLICSERIGVQYQAGNVHSFVKGLRWFADHPSDRREMGLRASKLFQKEFSVEVIYPRLIEYLRQIVNLSTPRA
jgi:glycosyltransferase involved in cell wall biosynthesis